MGLDGRSHAKHIIRRVLVIVFTKRRGDNRVTGIMALSKRVVG